MVKSQLLLAFSRFVAVVTGCGAPGVQQATVLTATVTRSGSGPANRTVAFTAPLTFYSVMAPEIALWLPPPRRFLATACVGFNPVASNSWPICQMLSLVDGDARQASDRRPLWVSELVATT